MKKICKQCGKENDIAIWEDTCNSCLSKNALERIQSDIKEAQTTGEKVNTWSDDYVVCPYCGHAHDTCLGYEDFPEIYEEGSHNIKCDECGKEFELMTFISYSWETRKVD